MLHEDPGGRRNESPRGVRRLVAAIGLSLVLIVAGCGPSAETVERTTDETALADIATTARDSAVRLAAVRKLTGQAALARIAVDGTDTDVRRAAAEKLTDPALLARMGMWVNPQLTQHVSDQVLLAKIAVEAKDWTVRRTAVERLNDPARLADIAIKDED